MTQARRGRHCPTVSRSGRTNTEIPKPGAGEVLVRMAVSGVNPTDWKTRQNNGPDEGWQIPGSDGAGRIVEVGQDVDPGRVNERVWLWHAAWQRPWGTAAEYTVVPATQAVPLGAASYKLGAALGIPFLTAHRCLTVGETLPNRLGPGSLVGRTVLVQGGAGAVGNAAIQLARWAGAVVISTVSSPEKARLAEEAGSGHVVNYRRQDVVAEVRRIAPNGVDVIVEVDAVANTATDTAVLGPHGTVVIYAVAPGDTVTMELWPMMWLRARWQFVMIFGETPEAHTAAVEDVQAAVAEGAVRVGDDAGLPLHRFDLAHTGSAHAAVAAGAVGKVLITINENPTTDSPNA